MICPGVGNSRKSDSPVLVRPFKGEQRSVARQYCLFLIWNYILVTEREKKSEREFRIELGNSVLNLETLSKQRCGQWPVAELDCSVLFLCMNLTMGKDIVRHYQSI